VKPAPFDASALLPKSKLMIAWPCALDNKTRLQTAPIRARFMILALWRIVAWYLHVAVFMGEGVLCGFLIEYTNTKYSFYLTDFLEELQSQFRGIG
jgi:hypothetical protein